MPGWILTGLFLHPTQIFCARRGWEFWCTEEPICKVGNAWSSPWSRSSGQRARRGQHDGQQVVRVLEVIRWLHRHSGSGLWGLRALGQSFSGGGGDVGSRSGTMVQESPYKRQDERHAGRKRCKGILHCLPLESSQGCSQLCRPSTHAHQIPASPLCPALRIGHVWETWKRTLALNNKMNFIAGLRK